MLQQPIYSIYKATNKVNGKSYIGYINNFDLRKQQHRIYNKPTKLTRAINKHGWDNFDWEIICQSLDGPHLLSIIEPYFIQYYDSYHNGYNMTLGGEGRKAPPWNKGLKGVQIPSQETRNKISKSMTGKTKTSEHKMKIGLKSLGRKHNLETIQKICETKKQKSFN